MHYHSYTLEPYHPGRRYSLCPGCGELSYTLYIDTETGEYLDETVGMCRRINSCGHHLPPREFYNQSNDKKMESKIDNITATGEIKPEIDHIPQEDFDLFAKRSLIDRRHNKMGALQFSLIKTWGRERAESALEEYDVWVARDFRRDQKYGAAFVQRDINGGIRNVKLIAYKPDGHRIKDGEDCLVYDWRQRAYINRPEGPMANLAGKRIAYKYKLSANQCFFGENLLAKYPDKDVGLVEGEKSAVICSMAAPEITWIASGGLYGCRWYDPEVYHVLQGRRVTLFPDLGAEEDWEMRAESMALDGIDVSIFCLEDTGCVKDEDRAKGLDIADYFTRQQIKQHPEGFDQQEAEIEKPSVKRADAPLIKASLSMLAPTSHPGDTPSTDISAQSTLSIEESYQVDISAIVQTPPKYHSLINSDGWVEDGKDKPNNANQ